MSPRLLLVDDDDGIRTIARMSLERLGGWSVDDAPSGEAALERLGTHGPFDAIVLDVMMPGLDGPTTLRLLRSSPLAHETPVVFMTAKASRSDRERLCALGAVGTIAKPFDPMTLPQQVAQMLDGRVVGAPGR